MDPVSPSRSWASLLGETPIQADFSNCEEANHGLYARIGFLLHLLRLLRFY